jgi:hypothetical protein
MTGWGLRGMIVHQVEDAASDRRAGLTTWGARARPSDAARAAATLVVVETVALVPALLPVLDSRFDHAVAAAALGGWLLFHGAAQWRRRTRTLPREWLSYGRMPLENVYWAAAPTVVAIALIETGSPVAAAWIVVDAAVRVPALCARWRNRRRVSSAPAASRLRGRGRYRPVPER